MSRRTENIIIIILVVAILAVGTVLGISLYKDKVFQGGETSSISEEQTTAVSAAQLDEILKQQMMYVNGIHYYYQSSSPQLSNDAMGASVYNNSNVNINRFVVAFCAYDADGKPIKIVQPGEEGEGGYVRILTYDFAKAQGEKTALAPNETCEDILMYVKNEPQIVTIKACVKSYESTEGVSWDNPYYKTFLQVYSGKELR